MRRRFPVLSCGFRAAWLFSIVLSTACSGGGGTGGGGGGAGGGGGSTSSTVNNACMQARHAGVGDALCDTGKGGPMRQIPLPGGGTMCIDETEVTVGQYQAFLASGATVTLPDGDPAKARCDAKTDHVPSCQAETCTGDACDNMPQTCVDQCDAKAYCVWAGKHLCGAIGGGALAIGDVNDPGKNEWMNACSAGGRDWPYGKDYDSQACNTSDQKPEPCGGPALTASYPACQAPAGPYDQVFDLSGNVSEWVDASQEGADWPELRCVIMGGSYVHYWGDASCAGATLEWPCNSKNPEFGFRCCSE